jgi:hypothetical protein
MVRLVVCQHAASRFRTPIIVICLPVMLMPSSSAASAVSAEQYGCATCREGCMEEGFACHNKSLKTLWHAITSHCRHCGMPQCLQLSHCLLICLAPRLIGICRYDPDLNLSGSSSSQNRGQTSSAEQPDDMVATSALCEFPS